MKSTVSNILRLLELHPDVQKMLETGKLEMGHARAILALAIEHQPEIAKKVSKQELSVRATEKLIRNLQATGPKETPKAKLLDPNIRQLQDDLSEQLGAPVVIQHFASGKGIVQIRYNSTDELDGILSKFK